MVGMDMVDINMVEMDIVDIDMVAVDVDVDMVEMDKQGLGPKGSSVDSILSFLPSCVTLSSVFVFVFELEVSTCVTLMLQVLSAVEETPAATLLAVLIPNLV